MNAGFVVTGALIVLGILLRWRDRDRFGKAAQILVLMTGAAYVVVGFAPADRHENMHAVLSALPILILGNFGLLLAALCPGELRAALRGAALLMGAVGLMAAVFFFRGQDLGLGMGGMERVAGWPLLVFLAMVELTDLTRGTSEAG